MDNSYHFILENPSFADIVILIQEQFNIEEFSLVLDKYDIFEGESISFVKKYSAYTKAKIAGICIYNSSKEESNAFVMVLFSTHSLFIEAICHESLHAAEYLCRFKDLPISKSTEEIRAQLTGGIASSILKYIHSIESHR